MMKFILVGLLIVSLLAAGCTTGPEEATDGPNIYNREAVTVAAYDRAIIDRVPICEDGVIIYVADLYEGGGMALSRDKDLVDKYCGCES